MSNLKTFEISIHSDEWFNFRTTGIKDYAGGIGASEIANILGLSYYAPSVMELFHIKVGSHERPSIDNPAMLHGRNLEDYVAKLWCYWNGTPEGYVERYGNDNVFRKNKKRNQYIMNPKYPFLFASLDYESLPDTVDMDSGEIIQKPFPIECKTISYNMAQIWEDSIPNAYLAQINQQMLITGSEYAEFSVLQGGNKFVVYPVRRSDYICETIITKGKEFWNKVIKGREIYGEYIKAVQKKQKKVAEELMGFLQQLEPEPDGTVASRNFMEENFLGADIDMIEGDKSILKLAKKREHLNNVIKAVGQEKSLMENKIIKKIVRAKTEYVNFPDNGKIRYYKRKNANSYTLSFQGFKGDPEENLDEKLAEIL